MARWCRIWLLCLFVTLPAIAIAGEVIGDIIAVEGKVTLRDNKARKIQAEIGMPIETGQLIKTASDSTAEISLADGSIFKIAPKSTFILDDFVVQGTDSRQMTARMVTGALQYISRPARFKKDKRKIMLANATASIRGTDLIAFVDRRIEAVLISGKVNLAARSNEVMLDRRGHSVTFDGSGRFEAAVILPDEDIKRLGDTLGWDVNLPEPDERGAIGIEAVPCRLVGRRLVCT